MIRPMKINTNPAANSLISRPIWEMETSIWFWQIPMPRLGHKMMIWEGDRVHGLGCDEWQGACLGYKILIALWLGEAHSHTKGNMIKSLKIRWPKWKTKCSGAVMLVVRYLPCFWPHCNVQATTEAREWSRTRNEEAEMDFLKEKQITKLFKGICNLIRCTVAH